MDKNLKHYMACVEHWLQLVAGKEIPAPIMEYFTTVLMTGEIPDPSSSLMEDAWNASSTLEFGTLETACYALLNVSSVETPDTLVKVYYDELRRLRITPPVALLR